MALPQRGRFNPRFNRQPEPEHRINERIRVPQVRLVGDNVTVGIYPTQEALGLYWRGRANMLNDKEAKEGAAVPYFQKFFEVGGESKVKPNLLMYPYQYMMIYYYNKEDKDNLKTWMDKVLSLNPNDPAAKQIQENLASTAKAAAPKGGAKSGGQNQNKK